MLQVVIIGQTIDDLIVASFQSIEQLLIRPIFLLSRGTTSALSCPEPATVIIVMINCVETGT